MSKYLIKTLAEAKEVAAAIAKSRFYMVDSKKSISLTPEQALIIILHGRELGVGAITATANIKIIHGKPAMGAALIAMLIKRSSKYRYKILKSDNKHCRIEFLENVSGKWESLGIEEFSETDANRAALINAPKSSLIWKKYPKALYFARTLTQGGRFHCADIFNGPIYTPEELGDDIVEGETDTEEKPQPAPEVTPKPDNVPPEATVTPEPEVDSPPITDGQLTLITDLFDALEITAERRETTPAEYGKKEYSEMTKEDGENLIKRLSKASSLKFKG